INPLSYFQQTSLPLWMLAIDAGETSGEMPLEHGSIARKNPQEPSDSSHESLRQYIEIIPDCKS
ncbi:hypothetical protein, partial [Pseudomonas lurida]|uniref:hypothetical protein n=1 Tax=Pseudomonas lurida TaxID=244566 RepID=UPI0034D9808A